MWLAPTSDGSKKWGPPRSAAPGDLLPRPLPAGETARVAGGDGDACEDLGEVSGVVLGDPRRPRSPDAGEIRPDRNLLVDPGDGALERDRLLDLDLEKD